MPELSAAVTGLSNLNKAVDSLFKNIMSEIDLSRQQMHELLEEIAVKDAYEKTIKKRKAKPKKVAASFSLFGKKKKPLDETDSEHSSDDDDVMMSDNTEELKIDLEDSNVAKEIFGSDEEEKAVLELSDNEFDDFEDAEN